LEALIEVIVPPPHLWIFGAGPDAVPLLVAGRALGWTTSLCDSQVRWQTRQRFMRADHLHLGPIERAVAACGAGEQSFALVMSHDYERDREAVGALLATRTRYIGVLGPRLRTLRIFDDLQRTGRSTTEADLRRIHAPMGLDLGAETPEEIALAVVAEIQAIRSGARAGFLRDQSGRIHTTDRQVATAMATSPTEALLAQTT
jgi:xanthine/CO dehydrogenase XdhC/CoxF family maturation factor